MYIAPSKQFVKLGNFHVQPQNVMAIGPKDRASIGISLVTVAIGDTPMVIEVNESPDALAKVVEDFRAAALDQGRLEMERQMQQMAQNAPREPTRVIVEQRDAGETWKG